jgi:hypothetical protein
MNLSAISSGVPFLQPRQQQKPSSTWLEQQCEKAAIIMLVVFHCIITQSAASSCHQPLIDEKHTNHIMHMKEEI